MGFSTNMLFAVFIVNIVIIIFVFFYFYYFVQPPFVIDARLCILRRNFHTSWTARDCFEFECYALIPAAYSANVGTLKIAFLRTKNPISIDLFENGNQSLFSEFIDCLPLLTL